MQLTDLDFKLSDIAVIVELPYTEQEARAFVKRQFRQLARWAQAFDRLYTEIRYQNDRVFKVLASMATDSQFDSILVPGIYADIHFLSVPLLQTLNLFLENPEEKWALVRLSDESQIAMTASCQELIRNATIEQAINRKRSEFWDANDLEEFRQITRQSLEPNNPQSIVQHRFKVVDRTGQDWRWMVSDYRLIEDNGTLYHISHNRGWEQASPGVLATART
ncbi:MAG TPA: hypothetical protein V6C65_21250 [Allocoleopsis sp.]